MSFSVARPRWRDRIGAIVTLISALFLAWSLWQTVAANRAADGDRLTLQREGIAVEATSRIVALMGDVIAYRSHVALSPDAPSLAAARADVDREFSTVGTYLVSGPPSVLEMGRQWNVAVRSWNAAQNAPATQPDGSLDGAVGSLQKVIDGIEDASGLTHDANAFTQNMADATLATVPRALDDIERSRLLAQKAISDRGLSLNPRMRLATLITAMRGTFDLSPDSVNDILAGLSVRLPQRAKEFAATRRDAAAYSTAGNDLVNFLSVRILMVDRPAASGPEIDALASRASNAGTRLFGGLTQALNAGLENRMQALDVRDRYLYLSLVLGAIFLVGSMLMIAQLVALRSRRALREARHESERLAAQLARQRAEDALRLTEAQFRAVFDGAALGIAIFDRVGAVVETNGVFRGLFATHATAILDGHEAEFAGLMRGDSDSCEYEHHALGANGSEIWVDTTLSRVSDDSGVAQFAMCMLRDVSALKHNERRMLHDQTHDALTGLPNRQLFEEQLRRRFQDGGALIDSFFAVMFIDLDRFKDVNESLGHAAGDFVLAQVAARLRASVDSRDIVARLGSDEFAVLVQSLGDILHVESIARRILNSLAKPMSLGPRSIFAYGSVGVAIGSAGYERAEDVMRDADIAMHHAKTGGGARYAVFDSKMHAQGEKRLQLSTDLRLALNRGEFRLLYQPIIDIASGVPIGCEALIRWDHPADGLMQPNDFMPLAEQIGMAAPIGRFVVQTACRQMAAWKRNREGRFPFQMHVNVSASELMDPDFEWGLQQVVEANGIEPHELVLEITENVVLDVGTRANATLERVRELGFNICIDDFGTGYSSLRYLQQFKVDSIKIDRSFVAGQDGELASEPIVRTLMTLADAYDVRVVAEGVESSRQRDTLQTTGCRLAQGYLISYPLSAAELVTLYPEVLGRLRSVSA
jgi:diguanylate cyclase (GGDEF)-like protein/PAS domain S-box-containing protein